MTHTYIINGMTCNSCKAKVEDVLKQLDSVTDVTVNLESAEASIETSTAIDLETVQSVLPEKYSAQAAIKPIAPIDIKVQSEWRQLFPLFLIFFYITMASILMHVNNWSTEAFMLNFMGLFYIVFSFFKFLDIEF